MPKATCLRLRSHAVLGWHTVHMLRIIQQRRTHGETILDEALSRISP